MGLVHLISVMTLLELLPYTMGQSDSAHPGFKNEHYNIAQKIVETRYNESLTTAQLNGFLQFSNGLEANMRKKFAEVLKLGAQDAQKTVDEMSQILDQYKNSGKVNSADVSFSFFLPKKCLII